LQNLLELCNSYNEIESSRLSGDIGNRETRCNSSWIDKEARMIQGICTLLALQGSVLRNVADTFEEALVAEQQHGLSAILQQFQQLFESKHTYHLRGNVITRSISLIWHLFA